ncbi:chorismate mutase [Amorphus orientalis]|uniref:chorismate mutase n=1 Tax=Amorphus orientalis TaxID=649198 RepID=A0AAE3VRX6_9HYPH|nr:chorismate mutase [Amorphus orientalis]MDQ0317090.1 chorismate mutase [Amorphus orientalis]
MTLDALRNRIDTIDAEVHALLMERARMAADIAATKGDLRSATIIQPDREARVLKRRFDDHDGVLPLPIIAHIWRTVISGVSGLQRPFQIHLSDSGDGVARDVARFWFGFQAGLVPADTAASALASLASNPGDLAVVPLAGGDGWWTGLGETAHVVARLHAPGRESDHCFLIGGALIGRSTEGATLYRAALGSTGDVPDIDGVDIIDTVSGPGGAHALIASRLPEETVDKAWREATGIDSRPLAIGGFDPDLISVAGVAAQSSRSE